MPSISSSLIKLFGRKSPKQPSFDSLHGFFPIPQQELDAQQAPQENPKSQGKKQPPFENSVAKFNLATKDHEDILASHDMWRSPELLTQIDVVALKNVLMHTDRQARTYGSGYDHESTMHWETVDDYVERGKTGLAWSLPGKFIEFQKHALESTHADDKHELMPLIYNVLMATRDYQNYADAWLVNAEHFIARGGQLPWPALASALYRKTIRHSDDPVFLQQIPLVIDFFNTQADDAQLVAWATSNVNNESNRCTPPQWLFKTHPKADIWRLGDDPKLVSLLPALSEALRDGALFKAWHGIELEPDEVIKFPLAQSLYVHKYAPIYREGVMPLPANWEVALSLAQTGEQFKAMAVQAYEAQKKNMEPVAFALPELS